MSDITRLGAEIRAYLTPLKVSPPHTLANGLEWPARCLDCGFATQDPDQLSDGSLCASTGLPHRWAGESEGLIRFFYPDELAAALLAGGWINGKDLLTALDEHEAILAQVIGWQAAAAADAPLRAAALFRDPQLDPQPEDYLDPGHVDPCGPEQAPSSADRGAQVSLAGDLPDLERLLTGVDHLLADHDCDAHGYEELMAACERLRAAIRAAKEGNHV